MDDPIQELTDEQVQTLRFFTGIFGTQMTGRESFTTYLSAEPPIGRNQPEFWADAPWRIEPDQDEISLLFLVRDTNITSPAKGPWRLDMLKVEQRTPDHPWESILAFLPSDLPYVDERGFFQCRTWTHSVKIPLTELLDSIRGKTILLRVTFIGSYFPYEKLSNIEVHLKTYLAEYALPLSRVARSNQPRQWFYGDTHYHSAYTNDIKEIGNPVSESCQAAHAIGLDWLVITDHSCDLDDDDPDISPKRRWDRLIADVSNPEISNDQFRCILGEEITLGGEGENLIHMLAFGGMDEMVEGAFLPDQGGIMTEVLQETIKKLLKKASKYGGYSQKESQRLFGTVHPFEEVLDMLPAETLTFAAHPFQFAQPPPPGKWDNERLYHPRLTGFEFWNGRSRRNAKLTFNPFEKSGWKDPAEQIKNDQARIKKLQASVESKWDLALRRGLARWADADELPSLRPVFIAGTDAHGSFNYSVGMSWDYRRRLVVDDNALGRVRTVVYLPDYYTDILPPEQNILAAVKKGSCVVTDGPIIEFLLEHNGETARMGDVLTISSGDDIKLEILTYSTPEFGSVEQVEVVTCFRHYRKSAKTIIIKDDAKTIELNGLQGYCRVFAQTVGLSGELFCCFTNPIWVRITDGVERKLQVKLG